MRRSARASPPPGGPPHPTPTSIVMPSSARARSANGSWLKSPVAAASDPRRRDQEGVVVGRGDHRLDALRLAGQEPVHRQAQLVTRIPGQGAPGALPQPRHLHHHQRELNRPRAGDARRAGRRSRPPSGWPRRSAGCSAPRPRPGSAARADRLHAGQRDRCFTRCARAARERPRGPRGCRGPGAARTVRGDAQLGVGLLDRAARQHVHADPLDVMARVPAGRSSAAYRDSPSSRTKVEGTVMTPARRAYSYGTGLANRQTSIAAPSRATFSAASRSRRYAAAISRRGSMPPMSPRGSSRGQARAPESRRPAGPASRPGAPRSAGDSAVSSRDGPAVSPRGWPGDAPAGWPAGAPGGGAAPKASSRAAAPDSMIRSTRSYGPTTPIMSSLGRCLLAVIGLFPRRPLTPGRP